MNKMFIIDMIKKKEKEILFVYHFIYYYYSLENRLIHSVWTLRQQMEYRCRKREYFWPENLKITRIPSILIMRMG